MERLRRSKPHPQGSGEENALRSKNGAGRLPPFEWAINRRLRRAARTSRSAIVAVPCERKSDFVVRRSKLAIRRFRRPNGCDRVRSNGRFRRKRPFDRAAERVVVRITIGGASEIPHHLRRIDPRATSRLIVASGWAVESSPESSRPKDRDACVLPERLIVACRAM